MTPGRSVPKDFEDFWSTRAVAIRRPSPEKLQGNSPEMNQEKNPEKDPEKKAEKNQEKKAGDEKEYEWA